MPKTVDPAQRRADFIAAGWNVIAEQGFSAVTLRRVAAEAGCTTGALTHYFSDRHALLVETLRAAHRAAGGRMRTVAAQAKTDYQRLHAVLLEALPLDEERLREWKVWLAFWSAAMSEASLARENARRYAEWRSVVCELLDPQSASASEEAELLLALVDGLGLQITRHALEGKKLARMQADCTATLERALKPYQP